MSTVVGIVENGKVWLGADSFATSADGERRRIVCKKIIVNGPYLIGHIGSVRVGQVIKPEFFTPPEKVIDFPDVLREHLIEKGCLANDPETQSLLLPGNLLVGTKEGKLYELLADFQFNEIIDYTVIGSGTAYSLGSLYTTRKVYNHAHRIQVALQSAALYDVFTGPPFIVEEFPK